MSSFRDDRAGSSLIEFALILPLILILLLSAMEVGQNLAVARRTARAAHTAADLATQVSPIEPGDAIALLRASTIAIEPFSKDPLGIVVSELRSDEQGRVTVAWSQALNATPLTAGSPVTVPDGVAPAGSMVVMGEAQYAYVPRFGSAIVGAHTIARRSFASPRGPATRGPRD